jgi:hypothetical protein
METSPLDRRSILDEAARQAGLSDFGRDDFLEPMGRLIDSANEEARLSPEGVALQHGRMVSHLVGRLRMFDTIARHPEIADEQVDVAAVICGMPRTGSTMFHRMLATAPGFTAVRWWETQNYAPFPGEARGNPVERRKTAEQIMDGYVKAGLMSIHPLAIDAPDEEIIILDQFFVGTAPEGAMYVPSYAAWLATYDHHGAYRDLVTVLKFLQWQDRSRAGKRWVLKTPGHLPTVETLFDTFPNAALVMTHRDPLDTVPSYCSMTETIYRMYSDRVDAAELGRFTEQRWAGFLRHFADVRERLPADRFIDVRYEDLVHAPLEQARRVLTQLDIGMSADTEAAMTEWLDENARDKRAAHHYELSHYGLTEDDIRRDFAAYSDRFLN